MIIIYNVGKAFDRTQHSLIKKQKNNSQFWQTGNKAQHALGCIWSFIANP